jgi:hypothetical protein
VRPAPLALGLVALTLAGCGPSAEVRFRDQKLAPVQRAVEQQKAQLSGLLNVARLGHKRDAQAVAAQVAVLGRTIDRMAALDPPGSVATAFRRFVVANRRLVVSLRHFAVRLGGHSNARLNAQAAAAQQAAGAVARARDALYALLK